MNEHSARNKAARKSSPATSIRKDTAPALESQRSTEAPLHAGADTVGLLHERFGNQALLGLMDGVPSEEFEAHVALAFHMGVAGMDASHAVPGGADNSAVMAMREALSSGRQAGFAPPEQSSPESLPGLVRERLEQVFGRDLGHVRIHRDSTAARASEDIGARAFAIGDDIWFGQNEWSPETESGVELIAHEVTHVLQADDNRLPTSSGPGLGVSHPSDPHELEAVARAREVAAEIGDWSDPSMDLPTTGAPGSAPRLAAAIPKGGLSGISDEDPDRALETRRLAVQIGAKLGLSLAGVDIRVDGEADRVTASRGTSALMKDGIIYVRPGGFDPERSTGQYALAHEMTHLAQQGLEPSSGDFGPEAEANAFATAFVGGGAYDAPSAGLSAGAEAALGDKDKPPLTLPPEKAQDNDPPHALEKLGDDNPHKLSNAVIGDFKKAAELVKSLTGIDITTDLGDSVRGLGSATTKAGADNFSWHKTGRALDLNQSLAWLIAQQDKGDETFFRLYLPSTESTDKKDGKAGGEKPGGEKPGARKPTDKKAGGAPQPTAPTQPTAPSAPVGETPQASDKAVKPPDTSGYIVTFPKGTKFHHNPYGKQAFEKKFVDVTAILEAHGFTRIPAQSGWGDSYNKREWWHYNKREGMTWYDAVRDVYSEDDFVKEMKVLKKSVGDEKTEKRLLAEGTPQEVVDKILGRDQPKTPKKTSGKKKGKG